jgi:hypothetical protein
MSHSPRVAVVLPLIAVPRGRHVEFVCRVGCHTWTTYEATTPWRLELDLDTMNECVCGTHCCINKTTSDSETLWIDGFDRDSLRVSSYLVSQSETMNFHMRSWICYNP